MNRIVFSTVLLIVHTVGLARAHALDFSVKTLREGGAFLPQTILDFDFDHDGDIDLVTIALGHTNTLLGMELYINDGQTSPSFELHPQVMESATRWHSALADFNGDGYLDICTAEDTGISILINDYPTSTVFQEKFISGGDRRWVECVDLNHSNKPDMLLITKQNNQNNFSVLYDYDINSTTYTETNVFTNVGNSLQLIDWDNDGDMDVLPFNGNQLIMWENKGGNPVQWQEDFISSRTTSSGIPQVINYNSNPGYEFLSPEGKNVVLYEKTGAIYTSRTLLTFSDTVFQVVGGDLDNDGDVDLIIRTGNGSYYKDFFIAENLADDNFDVRLYPESSGAIHSDIKICDLNMDGDSDIVVAQYVGAFAPAQKIFILHNLKYPHNAVRLNWADYQ